MAPTWSHSLPEVGGLSRETFDPARVEESVRAGYQAGFEAGTADGYAAGQAAAVADVAASTEDSRRQAGAVLLALRDQLHRVAEAERAMAATFEEAVLDAAFRVAEAIVGRELAVATDPGRDAIRRALAVAPSGPAPALVRLHPIDVARLGPLDDLALGREVTVVADAAVATGDCLLTIGATDIDAGIAAALERVAAVLRGDDEA